MALTRRIARPLLASVFIVEGVDALRHPEAKAKAAQAVTVPLTRRVPALPDDPELLVRVNGAVQVGAGLLLAVGRFRRLAALALIGSIVPTTYAGHRFWEEDDETIRAQQQAHFAKNLGLLGGLILAAADTEGAPSLGWRARRRAARLGAAVAVGRAAGSSSARTTGSSVAHDAHLLAQRAQQVVTEVGRQADVAGRQVASALPGAGKRLADHLTEAGERSAETLSHATHAASGAVAPYLAAGTGGAESLVGRAQDLLNR
jgi:uncharacterized membrane protein YphA (DoxX/SURF4 family)